MKKRNSKDEGGKRSSTVLRKGEWNPKGKFPKTKAILAEHGLPITDKGRISDIKGAAEALREMAAVADQAEKMDYSGRAETLIKRDADMGEAICKMMQFEDVTIIIEESQNRYLDIVKIYRKSLDMELAAIEHAVKRLQALKIEELASNLAAITAGMENPTLRKLMSLEVAGE